MLLGSHRSIQRTFEPWCHLSQSKAHHLALNRKQKHQKNRSSIYKGCFPGLAGHPESKALFFRTLLWHHNCHRVNLLSLRSSTGLHVGGSWPLHCMLPNLGCAMFSLYYKHDFVFGCTITNYISWDLGKWNQAKWIITSSLLKLVYFYCCYK